MRGFSKEHKSLWLCKCNCGNETVVAGATLKRGNTKSCGCLQIEFISNLGKKGKSHGMSHGHLVYYTWTRIKDRCYNKRGKDYEHYGGRGVRVCKRWLTFENFYKDMGDIPSCGHSIDRVDNNGDYRPENCRWATIKEQANNKRNNRVITYRGEKKTIAQWSEKLGVKYGTLFSRLNRGLSFEESISEKKYGNSKKIIQYTMDKQYVSEFDSIAVAGMALGRNAQNISCSLRNYRGQTSAYGFIWEYAK
jgi:hypothetical protein